MRLFEMTELTDDQVAELCQKMEPLLPRESLPERIRRMVPDCDHPEVTVCQKVARNGALMYFKVCTTCGGTMASEKGELSHRTIATRYQVEEIEDKVVFDLAGEEFSARVREKRAELMGAYSEYLRSTQWQALRQAVIQRDRSCRVCQSPIECVHHVSYERLFDEDMGDLVGLCQTCHEIIHEATP